MFDRLTNPFSRLASIFTIEGFNLEQDKPIIENRISEVEASCLEVMNAVPLIVPNIGELTSKTENKETTAAPAPETTDDVTSLEEYRQLRVSQAGQLSVLGAEEADRQARQGYWSDIANKEAA